MGCNKIFPGQNDLATVRPDVAAKWNYALNGDLTPDKVAWSSGKRAWFHRDVCGQDYDTLTSNACKAGCPYCGHKRVLPGVTDFVSQFPEIVPEWDTKKNDISPSEVFPFENRKRWWICEKGILIKKQPMKQVIVPQMAKDGWGCPSRPLFSTQFPSNPKWNHLSPKKAPP